jgi:acyl carrier protein
VFAAMDEGMPPLRGIFHAAGVLDNDTLARLDWERFEAVMAPKTVGTIHLHELCEGRDLDYFVLFSSVAAVLGSPGQGNYAAGNAFQDAFAHYRRGLGLPAISINWGPWRDVGMAAQAESEVRRQWAAMGIGSIPTSMGIGAFDLLLRSERANAGVLPIEWGKLLRLFPPDRKPPLLDEVAVTARIGMEPTKEWLEFVERLREAPATERKSMMLDHLMSMAVEVLELDSPLNIDPRAPLNELGFDSLMAVDLANQLGSAAGVPLSATLLFDHPTLDSLSGYILEHVVDFEGRNKGAERAREAVAPAPPEASAIAPQPDIAVAAAEGTATTEELLDSIREMTDEEVESRFDESLARQEQERV